MATVERLYAEADDGQMKYFYTINDANNRLLSTRVANNSPSAHSFKVAYQGQSFEGRVESGQTKVYDVTGQWGTVNINEVEFQTWSG